MSDSPVKRLCLREEAKYAAPWRAEQLIAAADRIEELKAKLAKAVEALELTINACDQGRMVTRPGRGVGGMTIEENIRGSIYINAPAWPIEEPRAALAEINGGGDT